MPEEIARNESVGIARRLWHFVGSYTLAESIVAIVGFVLGLALPGVVAKVPLFAFSAILLVAVAVAKYQRERQTDERENERDALLARMEAALSPVAPRAITTPVLEPPAERIILDIDASVLIGIKNSAHTIAEKQRLWKPYVGKWIRVSGPVADVSETKLFLANYRTPAAGLLQLVLKFDAAWSDRLSVIQKGSNVTILGCIDDFEGRFVALSRCELMLGATTQSQSQEIARLNDALNILKPRQLTAQQREAITRRVTPVVAPLLDAGRQLQVTVNAMPSSDCAAYARDFEELLSSVGLTVRTYPRPPITYTRSLDDADDLRKGVTVLFNPEHYTAPYPQAFIDGLKDAAIEVNVLERVGSGIFFHVVIGDRP